MANHWLRLWTDLPNDPKWRTISRVSKQPITSVISVYIHMLVAAANNSDNPGHIEGWVDEDIASALDLDESDVVSIREAMQGRVLDGDYLSGWEKRQPKREESTDKGTNKNTERVRRFREKQRTETHGNALKRTETHGNAPDAEADTEAEYKITSSLQEDVCPEPSKSEAPDQSMPEEKEPPVLLIPLVTKDKTTGNPDIFPITQSQIDQWGELFPALDVPQVLREIKAWNLANPANRKTKTGILKHITGWLTKEQNKVRPTVRGQPYGHQRPLSRDERNRMACEEAIRRRAEQNEEQ